MRTRRARSTADRSRERQATTDLKTKQVVYHDWEAGHYDEKWSISFDERCIAYAYGRLAKVAPVDRVYPRVLEIGCGTGFFALNLAQTGIVGEAWCVDISTGMVATALANARRLGERAHGCVADAEALPFENGVFDLVLGHAVAHHLPDVAAALAETRRVLRPGGRLVLAGEPTRTGDRVAAQWKRLGRLAVGLAALAAGPDRVLADPVAGTSADRAAAGLEWEVDLHCFAPAELEALARRAGLCEVLTVTEELTANWFGWFTRTVEAMVDPALIPDAYRWFAYRTWRRLFAFDERVAGRVVPKEVFYNCILTGVAPLA